MARPTFLEAMSSDEAPRSAPLPFEYGARRAKEPFVSVVIPCLDESDWIEECLSSLLEQTYPRERMEIILADGGSSDGTVDIARRFAARHPELALRVVENPDRIQAAGCNRAIRSSRGEVIVRLDAHARYDRDYVASSVRALLATGADSVGGAARPIHRCFVQRAVAIALQSPLAVGGAAYRSAHREGWVDTVWNGAFRRTVFERIGLYDPRARTNEDSELNLRITRAGGRIYLSRALIAYYYPRASLPALFHQYLRYGIGRARTTVKHKRLQTLRPLAPFFLVTSATLLAYMAPFANAARVMLGLELACYGAGITAEALRLSRAREARLFFVLFAIFPTMHIAHGVGFACGLARFLLRADWNSHAELLVPSVQFGRTEQAASSPPSSGAA